MTTRELRHFSVEVTDPYDVLCTGINANQNTEYLACETLMLLGGFWDDGFVRDHAPRVAELDSAESGYGPRVGRQLLQLVDQLREDPDTRQAVLELWRADDLPARRPKPCTLTLGFFIRRGRLELDVTMRSNDVDWGFKNDMFVFTQLQLSVASVLGCTVGPYRHTAYSMHLYARSWDWAEQLTDAWHAPIKGHPTGVSGEDAATMMARARSIAEIQDDYGLANMTASEHWYRRALGWE